jgi:hypothetical protein
MHGWMNGWMGGWMDGFIVDSWIYYGWMDDG